MKKIVSTLLLFLVCLQYASAVSFVEGKFRYNILDENAKTVEVTYYENTVSFGFNNNNPVCNAKSIGSGREITYFYSGNIVIPSSVTHDGVTYTITRIGYRAFDNCNKVTSITIPNTVTSIEGYALRVYGNKYDNVTTAPFSSLTTVTFEPGSKLESIGSNVLSNCDKLVSITIPSTVTEIGNGAFSYCTGLTSFVIPSSLTSISNSTFLGCTGLTSIIIPNSVTSIEKSAFYYCSGLTSVEIPNSVINIDDDAFWLCSGLKHVINHAVVPQTITKYVFRNLTLSGIKLSVPKSSVNAYKAADVWKDFNIVGDLPEIDSGITGGVSWRIDEDGNLRVWPTNGVEGTMSDARPWSGHATEIKTAKFDNGVHASTSCYRMFDGCTNLTSIDFGDFDTSNVENMRSMFSDCSSLTTLDVSGFNTQNVTQMNSMFYNCSNLSTLNVSNFNTRNVIGMTYMFGGCSGLTALDLSNFDTFNVTDMSNMFDGCSGISDLKITSFNTSNVKDMRRMFAECLGLTTLNISKFNTSNVKSMSTMFWRCSSLKELDLTNFDTRNVETMAWMFSGCISLEKLDISKFNTQNVTDMDLMFNNCNNLTELNLSSFNTEKVTDMSGMFWYCTSLKTLDLSNFNTQNVKNISSMFVSCSSLESLNLTNLTNVNSEKFSQMFDYCNNLKSIYSDIRTPSALKSGTFDPSLPTIGTCKLYVPKGSLDAYKNADGWKELLGNIVEVEKKITLTDGEVYTNNETAEYDEISYVRKFNNKNWQALYIPFSMSYDDWKDNFEVARINAFFYNNGDVNDQYLNVIKVTSGSLEPNTPYLIKALEAGEKTIKVENATLYPAEENFLDCASIDYRYVFTGTYTGVSGEEMLSEQYFAMTGGSLKRASSASAKLSPYRWYVKEESRHGNTSSAKPSIINIVVEGEDDTTGILNLTPETGTPETIYNLQGQSVDAGQLAPGIYIRNGKKFIVK